MDTSSDAIEGEALEERNKRIVVEVYQRLEARDTTVFEEHPGLREHRRYLPLAWAALPDLTGTIEQVMVEGDRVAIHTVLRGTHTGEGFLGPPTGKDITFQAVGIERLAGGKIVEHHIATHWISVFFQLGLLTVPQDE